jgi:gentisate 1,2-dioxygenase
MNPPTNVSAPANEREHFNAELEQLGMKPLWVIYREVMTREPRAREVPYLWAWEAVRPLLLRAGELITAEEAERRVLMFLNPGNPPQIGATATLYAAAQLILPGETARAHRHSPAALRFIIEGEGAYTCVEGEKIFMAPGDLVLTPAMVWHDHGNEGSQPVMWLDGLDIPLTTSLNCMFVDGYSVDGRSKESQTESVPRQRSEKLYGRGLFPSESLAPPARPYSPVWAYRWTEAREALQMLARSTEPDPFDGTILRYVNPATGGEVLPTMGCCLQLLRKGKHTAAHRHTPSTVYHVAEGSGYSILDGVRFDWRKGDTFAIPIWRWHEHVAESEDAVLFSVTDEPVLAPLGLVRSEAYAENGGFQQVRSVFG